MEIEEALREKSPFFHSLLGGVPYVIICLTTDGKITEFNPEAERFYGYGHEEVLGQNYFELSVSGKARKSVVEAFQRIMVGQITRAYENPIISANGETHSFVWNINRALDAAGEFIGGILIGQNITKAQVGG